MELSLSDYKQEEVDLSSPKRAAVSLQNAPELLAEAFSELTDLKITNRLLQEKLAENTTRSALNTKSRFNVSEVMVIVGFLLALGFLGALIAVLAFNKLS